MSKLVFCLMGPTASGKTALACELAQHFPFEIISVDSAMVYRGMDIGTAKPDSQTLAQTPHHLLDILDPPESYSAALFCDDANRLCQQMIARARIPLLVGGTMMYFRALQQGLSVLPAANDVVRSALLQQAQTFGWDHMHQRLISVDPAAAKRIHPHDTQRIQRALEVYELSGKPLSDFLSPAIAPSPYRFVNIILMPQQRQWLHEHIELRFQHMLAQGFVAEVEHLLQQWHLTPAHPSMRSVGYRQVIDYLHGDYDYPSLSLKAVAATRQLAKRQLTWLRHWPEALFFSAQDAVVTGHIIAEIRQILDNPQ